MTDLTRGQREAIERQAVRADEFGDYAAGTTLRSILAAHPTQKAEHDRMADEMDDVAIEFAHRMALELECVLVECVLGSVSDATWERATEVASDYRTAMNEIHERMSPTFMGEPVIPHRTGGKA